jgi:hypothetical protein
MLMRSIASIVLVTWLLAACGSEQPSTPTAGATPHRSPSASAHRCHHDQLSPSLRATGSTMSQPFVTVALRNDAAEPCSMKGYPALAAFGHAPGGPTQRLPIEIHRGSVYEREDPGARTVVLPSQGAAVFTVGTATAYGGADGRLAITSLRVAVPHTAGTFAVPVNLDASSPARRPVPVRVTALQLGRR